MLHRGLSLNELYCWALCLGSDGGGDYCYDDGDGDGGDVDGDGDDSEKVKILSDQRGCFEHFTEN